MMNFALNTGNFVLRTRNCAFKTRIFVFKMMNFAGFGRQEHDLHQEIEHGAVCS